MSSDAIPTVPTLPVRTQRWDQLRRRFPECVKRVWNIREVEASMQKHPGIDPAQIFDCPNGLRLIVSRDLIREPDYSELHVSMSANDEKALRPCGLGLHGGLEIARMVANSFYQISGLRLDFKWPPDFCSEPKLVPHWFFPDIWR